MSGSVPERPLLRVLDRVALTATLLCPVFLMHGRGFAEATIAVTGLCFLVRSAVLRDWRWLRTPWLVIGLLWWGWLVLCSVPFLPEMGSGGLHSLLQAVMTLRFLVFVAALEHMVLRAPDRRRWLTWLLRAGAIYIAAQSLLQAVTGRDLFGWPRYGDGALTGPYREPRAGPVYARLLFPAMLPPANRLLGRGRWALAGALALGSVAVAVLIGQRMPLLLTGLGLLTSAVLLPRLRPIVLGCCVAVPVLVGLTLWVSPPTYHKVVVVFSRQMEHLPESTYGRIWQRALVIAEADPVTGRGFDGFRTGCPLPRFFHGWSGGDGGGAAICVQHPHNHYLQAVTDSGVPGLALFCLLVLAWLRGVGRGLWRDPDPLRVGLFVGALIQEWPLASASSYTSMPLGGWFFVILGLGLAESRAYMAARRQQEDAHG